MATDQAILAAAVTVADRLGLVLVDTALLDADGTEWAPLDFAAAVSAWLGEFDESAHPRDERGRFGEGDGGATAQESHGNTHTIEDVGPGDAAAVRDEVDAMLSAQQAAGNATDGRDLQGFRYTMDALEAHDDYPGENVSVLVARNDEGQVTGAVAVVTADSLGEAISNDAPGMADTGPVAFVTTLGSTHLTEGAGTALVREAAQRAAAQGAAMIGDPTPDAVGFWEGKIGWTRDPTGTASGMLSGFTAAETAEFASTGAVQR